MPRAGRSDRLVDMAPELTDLPGFHDHLELCLRLAEQALDAGDSALGSVLVAASGPGVRTAGNRADTQCDASAPPELALHQPDAPSPASLPDQDPYPAR